VSYTFDSDSFRVKQNKSGEGRSSDLGDLDVKLYEFEFNQKIFLNWIEISTSGKRLYQLRLIPRWTKKIA